MIVKIEREKQWNFFEVIERAISVKFGHESGDSPCVDLSTTTSKNPTREVHFIQRTCNGDELITVTYNQRAYILNNEGQTIENISSGPE